MDRILGFEFQMAQFKWVASDMFNGSRFDSMKGSNHEVFEHDKSTAGNKRITGSTRWHVVDVVGLISTRNRRFLLKMNLKIISDFYRKIPRINIWNNGIVKTNLIEFESSNEMENCNIEFKTNRRK